MNGEAPSNWRIEIKGIPMPDHIREIHQPNVSIVGPKPDWDEAYCDLRIFENDRCVFAQHATSLGWAMQNAALHLRPKTALELGLDDRYVVSHLEWQLERATALLAKDSR